MFPRNLRSPDLTLFQMLGRDTLPELRVRAHLARSLVPMAKRALKPLPGLKAVEEQLGEWMRVRKVLHFDMWAGMKVMSWVGSVVQMNGNAVTFEESMQTFRCHFFMNLFERAEVTRDDTSTTVALRGDPRSDTVIISDVRRPVNIEEFTPLTKGVH